MAKENTAVFGIYSTYAECKAEPMRSRLWVFGPLMSQRLFRKTRAPRILLIKSTAKRRKGS